MKQIFISIIILICSLYCSAQIKYKSLEFYNYIDKNVTDSLIHSLKRDKVNKIIIFQSNNSLKSDSLKYSENTFIIWVTNNKVYSREITENFITSIVELKNSKIFQYNYILKCGRTNKEQYADFEPPWLGALCVDFIIYYDNKITFFFEYADIVKFNRYKIEAKKRKEWLAIIKNELEKVKYEYRAEKPYIRELSN